MSTADQPPDSESALSFNLGARRASSPIVSLDHVERELRAFNEESTATRQLCSTGGTASSQAFVDERAADDAHFTALRPELRDANMSIASQLRRDVRIADASPVPPPSFALASSSVSRPVSRTPTVPAIGSEEDLSAGKEKERESTIDIDRGDVPIAAPDVFKALKLIPAPVPKAGGKAENTLQLATRTSANTVIIATHVLAAKTKNSGLALQFANKVYALKGKIAHDAAGGRVTPVSLGHLDVVRIQAQISKIEWEVSAIRLAPALHDHTIDGAAHDTVALSRSMSQLAQETQVECGLLYEGQHKLRPTQRLLTEDATILSASVESLATMHDSLVATNAGLESQVTILEGKVASGAAKLHQLELASQWWRLTQPAALTGTTNSTAIPVDTAPVTARSFDLRKARKRPAATKPDTPQAASKRAKGAIPTVVREKSDYASWARMGPVANVSGTPANILKRILAVALGDTYIAPIVFIERDAHGLLIGFVKHADTTYLVRRWAAKNSGPFPLIKGWA
ncbi:hypothetical protein B0H10DRAFT_2314162 [Mycena sp. CBHHK59/15]|nr:hypothetical protein B0H10DRAFT_2314162 [Mycena sp. CBHHK59/15]